MLVEFASVVNAVQYAIAWQEGMTESEQARDEAEPYDRVLEDIFAVQDEVTQAIVAAIAPELGKAEQLRATAAKAETLTAWDLYQRGMWHLYRRTRDDLAEARRQFEAALAADSNLGLAHAGLVDA